VVDIKYKTKPKTLNVMKTLNQTILVTILILSSSVFTMGGSLKKFNIYLSNNKVIEVFTKEENLAEETLPVFTEEVTEQNNQMVNLLEWLFVIAKAENEVEDVVIYSRPSRVVFTDEDVIQMIKAMGIKDSEVNEPIVYYSSDFAK